MPGRVFHILVIFHIFAKLLNFSLSGLLQIFQPTSQVCLLTLSFIGPRCTFFLLTFVNVDNFFEVHFSFLPHLVITLLHCSRNMYATRTVNSGGWRSKTWRSIVGATAWQSNSTGGIFPQSQSWSFDHHHSHNHDHHREHHHDYYDHPHIHRDHDRQVGAGQLMTKEQGRQLAILHPRKLSVYQVFMTTVKNLDGQYKNHAKHPKPMKTARTSLGLRPEKHPSL